MFEQVGVAIFRLKRGNETLEELSKLKVANKTLKAFWWSGGAGSACDSDPVQGTLLAQNTSASAALWNIHDRGYPGALGLNESEQ